MKTTRFGQRFALAALALTITAAAAGCATANPSTTAPAASHAARPAPTPSAAVPAASNAGNPNRADLIAILPSIIHCMRANGVSLATGATGKQTRQAFRALPLPSQQRVFAACKHLLPPAARQVIANDLTAEKAAGL